MPIRCLIYVEKFQKYYKDIVETFKLVPSLDVVNVIYEEKYEDQSRRYLNLMKTLESTKCDTIIIFSIDEEFKDIFINKIINLSWEIQFIYLPIQLDCKILKSLLDHPKFNLKICQPFRHLNEIWKAYNQVIQLEENSTEPDREFLQYIEAKLSCPVITQTLEYYGSKITINKLTINHFTRLLLLDTACFVVNRNLTGLKSSNRSFLSEINRDIKNQKCVVDYSIQIGTFKSRPQDCLQSLTSRNATIPLESRLGLFHLDSNGDDTGYKLKIKMSKSTIKLPAHSSNPNQRTSTSNRKSLWSSPEFSIGLNNGMRQLELIKQQNLPRLVDLTSGNEDDLAASKISFMTSDLLCQIASLLLANEHY